MVARFSPKYAFRSLVLIPLLFTLVGVDRCTSPDSDLDGWTVEDGDCDDSDPDVYPAAPEHCDGLDSDCDQQIDEYVCLSSSIYMLYYRDADGDGFGFTTDSRPGPATGYVPVRGDCDDRDASFHPGAIDPPTDGVDQDCGGSQAPEPHVGLADQSATSIQSALDLANPGAIVWVGPGTYYEHDLTFGGKAVTLRSTHSAWATTVDAQESGPVMVFQSGETGSTIVDGLTVIGGNSDQGGGMYIASNPTITHCFLTGNRAGSGGGMYILSSPLISHCTVFENSATSGGGADIYYGSPRITHSIIASNSSLSGGGIRSIQAFPLITYSLLASNWASGAGGGIDVSAASPTISNCILVENSATFGGALNLTDASPNIEQSVVVGNSAQAGGGLYISYYSWPKVSNTILAYNAEYNIYSISLGTPTVAYSDLYSPTSKNSAGLGTLDPSNLTLEPGFLSYDSNGQPSNFHLAETSPLVDLGDPALLDRDPSRSDMGAFGGPDGDDWDLDGDLFPDYFWPGTIADAPTGFSRVDYDTNDQDPLVH